MNRKIIFETIVFGEPGAFVEIGNRRIERSSAPKLFLKLGVLPDCLCYENDKELGFRSIKESIDFVLQEA